MKTISAHEEENGFGLINNTARALNTARAEDLAGTLSAKVCDSGLQNEVAITDGSLAPC